MTRLILTLSMALSVPLYIDLSEIGHVVNAVVIVISLHFTLRYLIIPLCGLWR